MLLLAIMIITLFSASGAIGQIACFSYGDMTSCNTRQGITRIVPLGPNSGIISQTEKGRYSMQPYTIIGDEPRRRTAPPAFTPIPQYPSRLGLDEPLGSSRLRETRPDLDLGLPELP